MTWNESLCMCACVCVVQRGRECFTLFKRFEYTVHINCSLFFFYVWLPLWFIAVKNLILSLFWDRIFARQKKIARAKEENESSGREERKALLKGLRLYKITHMLWLQLYSSENLCYEIQCNEMTNKKRKTKTHRKYLNISTWIYHM